MNSAITTAKNGAISTAAADATSKANAAEAAAKSAAQGYANTAESNAKAYTDAEIGKLNSEKQGTGTNTGLDVTVKLENGKVTLVTIDDSDLVIDCGTYE